MRLIDADYARDEILFGEAYVSDELAVYIKRLFEELPTIFPDSLVRRGRCELCEDYDNMANMVCYIPSDNGDAKDIPVKFCPACGGALMED